MILPSLIQRLARKSISSDYRSLAKEGAYFILQSEPVREVLGSFLIQRNDIEVVGNDKLFSYRESDDTSRQTFIQSGLGNGPIPQKTRVSASTEFSDLDSFTPINPAVVEIPDCRVLNPFGLTLQNKKLINPVLAGSESSEINMYKALSKSLLEHGPLKLMSLLKGKDSEDMTRFSVATPLTILWHNYYHWTIDCLPRMAGIRRYERETDLEPTIIVPENPPSWMIDSLKILQVEESRLHRLSEPCHVDNLVVTTAPGPTPAECEWLRNEMLSAVNTGTGRDKSLPDRIFISRKDATRRRIQNDNEVQRLLQSFGFVEFELSNLEIRDQIKVFADADVIVSPHGAGLANIIYSTSVDVIELFGESKKSTYYRLAKFLDHEYHSVINSEYGNDLIVDTEKLKETLIRVCGG
jgi:capsular polysaccharide biosynthesis protein